MSSRRHRRLSSGGNIDQSKSITFGFNGKSLIGYEGDTIASALLANGVKTVTRSFKFHRPRGVVTAGCEEPNALLNVDFGAGSIPLVRTTTTPLKKGMKVESLCGYPSVRFDVARVLDYTRVLWPAGFYNKIFKWPNWHVFEWAIRRMAGVGRLPRGEDPTRYAHINGHCGLLVVGGGPEGLRAALDAARSGIDVIIAEQDSVLGGSLHIDPEPIDGTSPKKWLEGVADQLASYTNVRIMTSATVVGYYDHNVLTIHDRSAATSQRNALEVYWKVRAARVVLATGATEQPMLFGNNDLPGVMLSRAVLTYAKRYGVNCGDRIVAVVNNDLAWRDLLAAADAGASVRAVVDVRETPSPELCRLARERGIEIHLGATPLRAVGHSAVKAFEFLMGSAQSRIQCDVLAMSGGMNPTSDLYSQAGGKLRYDESLACFVPDHCEQRVKTVGAASGIFSQSSEYDIAPRTYAPVSTRSQWVDFRHDVTISDLELAVRENYVSVEHMKRYTTTGMSVDQGKTSNLNALIVLGSLTERKPGEVGTTTYRPQFMPVTMGAIAGNRRGDFYAPPRLLAAHEWHVQHGAEFDDYGGWKRPAFYGRDREQSIEREVQLVRNGVGIFDGSPLGKIEVKGPDAAEFLNRIYVNTVPTLKAGKVRYGLMLNENGVVIDDGVFVRLADDHFLINTTSGSADRIADWLEEWRQCEWPNLDVVTLPVTSQWAVATLAGPASRDVLARMPGMIDLSTESFPHMSFSERRFDDGFPFRIQRVSYSGEMSFELSVPAGRAVQLFETLADLGREAGLAPFGIEALMVLRTEKGFLHVGVDTDGTTNPLDVGFGGIVANKKGDFIGARSLRRPADQGHGRRQLTGFIVSGDHQVHAGAHFVAAGTGDPTSQGFVTSAFRSPTLGRTIGLGLLERGSEREGEKIEIFDNGQRIQGEVTSPCFYDPDGSRMRA